MRLQREKKRLEIERENFSSAELNKMNTRDSLNLRKSHDVPNYDDLYKKFTSELEAKRYAGQSKTTVCKPFPLQTNERAQRKAISKSRISSAISSSGRQSTVSFNDSMSRLRTLFY